MDLAFHLIGHPFACELTDHQEQESASVQCRKWKQVHDRQVQTQQRRQIDHIYDPGLRLIIYGINDPHRPGKLFHRNLTCHQFFKDIVHHNGHFPGVLHTVDRSFCQTVFENR